jgi:hypothetical protein
VPIVTDAFDATAREMAELWGVPDFRFVMMPHPLGSLVEADMAERAEHLVSPVLDLLRRGQPG